METTIKTKQNTSYKNAFLLNELSQALQDISNKMENSVALFDAIGEKNETFKKFEESINNPFEGVITMTYNTQELVKEYLFNHFYSVFKTQKKDIDFVHYTITERKIIFFISTQNEVFKKKLEKVEYDYFIDDLSKTYGFEFCFLESDMEKGLFNTEKIIL